MCGLNIHVCYGRLFLPSVRRWRFCAQQHQDEGRRGEDKEDDDDEEEERKGEGAGISQRRTVRLDAAQLATEPQTHVRLFYGSSAGSRDVSQRNPNFQNC